MVDGAVHGQHIVAASARGQNEIQPGFVELAVFTLWVFTSGDAGLPFTFCGVHWSCLGSEDPGQKHRNRNVSKCKVSRGFCQRFHMALKLLHVSTAYVVMTI